ncbi:MAG: cyclic nucleotide-binding domain-containing protein [Deltaproteobacteria bacterium]|nr:cyclic nucleotide-binding domain-containing protein [Deltaproteobacteria bacterium]
MAGETPRARTALLEQTRWANDFDGMELETLAGYLRVDRRLAGQPVCREGDRDGTLFILVEGSASVVKDDGTGRQQTLATLGPGHTLGEMALVDGSPRSATVVAATDLLLLALGREGLDRLCEERPKLAVKVLRKLAVFLSQRLRQTSGALAERLGS